MAIKHKFKVAGIEYEQTLRPLQAIRKACLDCVGGKSDEVKDCHLSTCPLWPFRFGKDPGRKPMSDERRAELRERFKKSKISASEPIPTEG